MTAASHSQPCKCMHRWTARVQAALRWGYRRFTKGNRVMPKELLDDAGDTELAVSPQKPVSLTQPGSAALKPAHPIQQLVPKLRLEQTSSRDLLIASSAESSARSQRSGFLHSQAADRLLASRANSWASQASPPRSARAEHYGSG